MTVRIAHLADLHLGFRQYYRQTSHGINQREADVAQAFRQAMADVASAKPDVVVIAGDVFHSVRPTNPAILHAFDQFRRLREALPEATVVIVAGDHDTARSTETGSILKLFEAVGGVVVVTHEPRELLLRDLDVSLFCVPHAALVGPNRTALVPQSDARHKLLIMHGDVQGGVSPESAVLEFGGALVEIGELNQDQWDYVALGHYHVAHAVAANAWYSGALEFVTANPWGELKDEAREGRGGDVKGWLLVTLDSGLAVEFQPIKLARRFIDLPPIQGEGLDAAQLDSLIAEPLERCATAFAGQVVRQVVYDVPHTVARDLDYTQVRKMKAIALHYHLDIRRPLPSAGVGVSAPGRRQTMREVVAEYLQRRNLPGGVDRQRLVETGVRLMEEVERDLQEE